MMSLKRDDLIHIFSHNKTQMSTIAHSDVLYFLCSFRIRKANGTTTANETRATSSHPKHVSEAYEIPNHPQKQLAEPSYHDLLAAEPDGENNYETLPDQTRESSHAYGNVNDVTADE